MTNRLLEDARSREIARTVFDRPIVLRAGAGTGKTAALVARVVAWLVGPGWDKSVSALAAGTSDNRVAGRTLRRVVAITFTEAAAAEMAERIAEALHALSTGCAVTGVALDELHDDARARSRVLLASVDQLEVRTIHSWCRNVLAEFPLEARLHPLFQVDASGEQTAQLVRRGVEEGLADLLDGDQAPVLLGLFERGVSPALIETAVAEMVDEEVNPAQLKEDAFGTAHLDATWLGLRNAITDLLDSVGDRLVGVRGRNGPALLVGLGALRDVLEPGADVEAVQASIDQHVDARLRGHLHNAWVKGRGGKGEQEALLDARAAIGGRALRVSNALTCIVGLDPTGYRLAQAVVGPIVERVQRQMRAHGLVSFTALLVRAARLLGNPSVAKRVRRRIDQLLVDEFQDTDPLQCDIIRAIALHGDRDDRPGLFLVGDPKQSIYGWRSADLRAYEGFVREVLADGGEEHGLIQNFRSTRTILDEVDRCMQGLLVPEPGVQPAHESLIAARGDGPQSTAVEAWVSWAWAGDEPQVSTSADAARRIEASALAADIQKLHSDGVCLSEVGVLFRSTTQLQVYQWALRDAGIPYEVTRDRNYFRRREVVECAAMIRAVVDPADTLALVSFLRSSMVQVPDAALLQLWRAGFPKHWLRLTTDSLVECAQCIREAHKDCRRVEPFIEGLDELAVWADHLVSVVGRVAILRETLQTRRFDLWLEDVRSSLIPDVVNSVAYQGVYRSANLERFFRNLAQRMEEGQGDIFDALRALRDAVGNQREAEESRPTTAGPAVQLMTIHKSKGLAFTHTYMVDLHHRFLPNSIKKGTYVAGPGFIQLMGMWSPGFETVWSRHQEVERAERARLLYVGMTRARDRLVLMGAWPERLAGNADAKLGLDLLGERQPALPDPLSLADDLSGSASRISGPHLTWVFAGRLLSSMGPRAEVSSLAQPVPLRATSETQMDWAMKRSLRPWTQGPSSAGDHDHEAQRGGVGRSEALDIGTAVHLLLERVAAGAAEATSEDLDACLAAAHGGPLSAKGQRRGQVLLDSLGRGGLVQFLKSVEVLGTEVPILMEGGPDGPVGAWVGSIDLLYRCPSTGEVVVADHKTDRLAGRDLSDVAQQHADQGRVYVEAVQRALGLAEPPRFEIWLVEADERVAVSL